MSVENDQCHISLHSLTLRACKHPHFICIASVFCKLEQFSNTHLNTIYLDHNREVILIFFIILGEITYFSPVPSTLLSLYKFSFMVKLSSVDSCHLCPHLFCTPCPGDLYYSRGNETVISVLLAQECLVSSVTSVICYLSQSVFCCHLNG